MAGSAAVERPRTAFLVGCVLALAGAHPASVGATEADATQVLPGAAIAAVTADLEGRGSGDVVRLLERDGDAGYSLEVWRMGARRWRLAGATQLQPPATAALLPWSRAGRDEVLVLSAGIDPSNDLGEVCCLGAHRLDLDDRGVRLEPMEMPGVVAEHIATADLDGDGTDELILTHAGAAEDGESLTRYAVLRWDGSRWTSSFEMAHPTEGLGVTIGDSDGVPGDEVLIGPSRYGGVVRLGWHAGAVTVEEGHLDLGERLRGWVVDIAGGTIVVTGAGGTRVVNWPRGQRPETVARIGVVTFPSVWVVGDGPDALVLILDGFPYGRESRPTMVVHDLRLEELGIVELDPMTTAVWDLSTRSSTGIVGMERPFYPYIGPFPGTDSGGPPGFASGGVLVEPAAGGFETRPIGAMIGFQPLGRAGPDGSWVVLGAGAFAPTDRASLSAHAAPFGAGRLSLTRVDDLLRSDPGAWRGSIELRDAVQVSEDGVEVTLLAAADGFSPVIAAPPGSVAVLVDGVRAESHEIGDESVELRIVPRPRPAGANQAFVRWIMITGPDGHGTVHRWDGTFVREPPELAARSDTPLFAVRTTISGRASGAAMVLVDGRRAVLGSDGAFRIEIDAPPWPHEIAVAARDHFGNETVRQVEVIGLVDYRALPWLVIVAGMTVALGVGMFVRTPRRRSQALTTDLDGMLEELDGD